MADIVILGGGMLSAALVWHYGGPQHVRVVTRLDVDLRCADATTRLLKGMIPQPRAVINVAAVVGGITFNMANPVATLEDNLLLATSVLRACHEADVPKVVSVLSTCIFPTRHEAAFDEGAVHDGPPHDTNAGYAYAKRALLALSQAYSAQYGREYVCVTPCNLFGSGDKFDEARAHVVGALVRRFVEAAEVAQADKSAGTVGATDTTPPTVAVYGTGAPLRQFLFADDAARLIAWAVDNWHDAATALILAPDDEVSIKDLAETIRDAVREQCAVHVAIAWDATKPDGQMRKRALNTRLRSHLPPAAFTFTPLRTAIAETVQWYRASRYSNGPMAAGPSAGPSGPRRALVIGATGQDGAYLCRLLLSKGYRVYASVRRVSTANTQRLEDILPHLTLVPMDVCDASSVSCAIMGCVPHEIYNLAAQSHVGESFACPLYTGTVDGLGVTCVLEGARAMSPTPRVYQASTSELYGVVTRDRQGVHSSMHPVSPYAIAKHYGYQMVQLYRAAHGLYACNGILFNHESEVRGTAFVTRKITQYVGKLVAAASVGMCAASVTPAASALPPLQLGNLSARRDWGHAEDYVQAMWLLLQQDKPRDIALGTGESHTVREFVEVAFAAAGLGVVTWQGCGLSETGWLEDRLVVEVDLELFRPCEVAYLRAEVDTGAVIGWKATCTFQQLVQRMVAADVHRARTGLDQFAFVDGRTV
jgi:GDPmannose 4,6-dehydratase